MMSSSRLFFSLHLHLLLSSLPYRIVYARHDHLVTCSYPVIFLFFFKSLTIYLSSELHSPTPQKTILSISGFYPPISYSVCLFVFLSALSFKAWFKPGLIILSRPHTPSSFFSFQITRLLSQSWTDPSDSDKDEPINSGTSSSQLFFCLPFHRFLALCLTKGFMPGLIILSLVHTTSFFVFLNHSPSLSVVVVVCWLFEWSPVSWTWKKA